MVATYLPSAVIIQKELIPNCPRRIEGGPKNTKPRNQTSQWPHAAQSPTPAKNVWRKPSQTPTQTTHHPVGPNGSKWPSREASRRHSSAAPRALSALFTSSFCSGSGRKLSPTLAMLPWRRGKRPPIVESPELSLFWQVFDKKKGNRSVQAALRPGAGFQLVCFRVLHPHQKARARLRLTFTWDRSAEVHGLVDLLS